MTDPRYDVYAGMGTLTRLSITILRISFLLMLLAVLCLPFFGLAKAMPGVPGAMVTALGLTLSLYVGTRMVRGWRA